MGGNKKANAITNNNNNCGSGTVVVANSSTLSSSSSARSNNGGKELSSAASANQSSDPPSSAAPAQGAEAAVTTNKRDFKSRNAPAAAANVDRSFSEFPQQPQRVDSSSDDSKEEDDEESVSEVDSFPIDRTFRIDSEEDEENENLDEHDEDDEDDDEEDEDGDEDDDDDDDEDDEDDDEDDEEEDETSIQIPDYENNKFLCDDRDNTSQGHNTKARLEALLEAADEAAQALNRMRTDSSPRDKNLLSRSLIAACTDNDVNAVRRLLGEGNSTINEGTDDGESLLSLACSAGYYELAQVLLAMSAQVEDRGQKNDCTPLMEAASAGHVNIIRLLISHGADVNAQSSTGNTPLMYACAAGHVEAVQELLESGANVEDHNENGHTPLMEAASAGHVEVAKILLEHGAGINTHSNEFKESALTLACYKGHLEMVRFLLEAGADQEHKTDEMHTALMEASMDGHVEVAKLLLDSGAQVNMPTDSFESPLTLAACGGHTQLAMLLIERGANIEEVNDESYTPLMEAAREGHEEMVRLLLAQGANINAQTEETQETALTLACCGGFLDVAAYLLRNGADIELGASTPLMEAAQEGHIDLVKFLLEYGADVHAQTQTGDTALTYACENGHTDVAEVLLNYNAKLEHESEGGRTPLMKACRAGHICTVKFLINKGAMVNRKTANNDHTPLSLACAGGHQTVVELLLKSGADPFYRLKDNSTMLIEAAKGGHIGVVQLLLDYPLSLFSGNQLDQSMPAPPGANILNSQMLMQAPQDLQQLPQPIQPMLMHQAANAAATKQQQLQQLQQHQLQAQLMVNQQQQQQQQQQRQLLTAPPGLQDVPEAVRVNHNEMLYHQHLKAKIDTMSEEKILSKLLNNPSAPILSEFIQAAGFKDGLTLGLTKSQPEVVNHLINNLNNSFLQHHQLQQQQQQQGINPGIVIPQSTVDQSSINLPPTPQQLSNIGAMTNVKQKSVTRKSKAGTIQQQSVIDKPNIINVFPTEVQQQQKVRSEPLGEDENMIYVTTNFQSPPPPPPLCEADVVAMADVSPERIDADLQQHQDKMLEYPFLNYDNPKIKIFDGTLPSDMLVNIHSSIAKQLEFSVGDGDQEQQSQLLQDVNIPLSSSANEMTPSTSPVKVQPCSSSLQQGSHHHQIMQPSEVSQETAISDRPKVKRVSKGGDGKNAVNRKSVTNILNPATTNINTSLLQQNASTSTAINNAKTMLSEMPQNNKKMTRLHLKPQFQQEAPDWFIRADQDQLQQQQQMMANSQVSDSKPEFLSQYLENNQFQYQQQQLQQQTLTTTLNNVNNIINILTPNPSQSQPSSPSSTTTLINVNEEHRLTAEMLELQYHHQLQQQLHEQQQQQQPLFEDDCMEEQQVAEGGEGKDETQNQNVSSSSDSDEQINSQWKMWQMVAQSPNHPLQKIAQRLITDQPKSTAGDDRFENDTISEIMSVICAVCSDMPLSYIPAFVQFQKQSGKSQKPFANMSTFMQQYLKENQELEQGQTMDSELDHLHMFALDDSDPETIPDCEIYPAIEESLDSLNVEDVSNDNNMISASEDDMKEPSKSELDYYILGAISALGVPNLPVAIQNDPTLTRPETADIFANIIANRAAHIAPQQHPLQQQLPQLQQITAQQQQQQQMPEGQLIDHLLAELQQDGKSCKKKFRDANQYVLKQQLQELKQQQHDQQQQQQLQASLNNQQMSQMLAAQQQQQQLQINMNPMQQHQINENNCRFDNIQQLHQGQQQQPIDPIMQSNLTVLQPHQILPNTGGQEVLNPSCFQHTQATQTKTANGGVQPNDQKLSSPSVKLEKLQNLNVTDFMSNNGNNPAATTKSAPVGGSGSGGGSKKNFDKLSRKDKRCTVNRHAPPGGNQPGYNIDTSMPNYGQPYPTAATPTLTDKTIDVDSETDSNHDTALTLACAGGHEELVELLINRCANIEHRDKKGFTPLILAATAGHVKVVEVLLKFGADMEAQSERTKDTPLSLACSGGRFEVVELLLNVGANKEHRNVSDYTPLSLAASGGYVNIIKLLLQKGAEINSRTGSKLGISPLMLAAMNGHTSAVKLLLDMGSDINAQIETNRNTALTLACFQGRHEVVSLLLDRKANVEHRAKTGLTPLMEAASGGYIEVGRVLLDKGADVNAAPVPSSRDTALTIAADKGHLKFVELLLYRGAAVEVKNKKGNSPLWLAANGGHLTVVESLYKHDADIDSQDNRKVSCLMAAFRKGHTKVVKWMVNHVTQFPSDQEMTRYISTVSDKELLEKCNECVKVIRAAKEAQDVKAYKNASILLEELHLEKTREESRKAAAARRREKKKKKKLEKKEEKRKMIESKPSEEKDDDDEDDSEKEDNLEEMSPLNLNIQDKEEGGDSGIDANSQGSCSSAEAKSNAKAAKDTNKKAKKKDKKEKSPANTSASTANISSSLALASTTTSQEPIKKKGKEEVISSKIVKSKEVKVSKDIKVEKKEEVSRAVESVKKSNEKENVMPKEEQKTTIKSCVPLKSEIKKQELVKEPESTRKGSLQIRTQIQYEEIPDATILHNSQSKNNVKNNNKFSEDNLQKSLSGKNLQPSGNVGMKRGDEGWKEVVRKSSVQQQPQPQTSAVEVSCKKIQVPVNAISRVIGRAGSNINAIRASTGAHIEVEKQGKAQCDRWITIKGNADATKQAHHLIATLIKDPDVDILQMLPKINPNVKPLISTGISTWTNPPVGVPSSKGDSSSSPSTTTTPSGSIQQQMSVVTQQTSNSPLLSNKNVPSSSAGKTSSYSGSVSNTKMTSNKTNLIKPIPTSSNALTITTQSVASSRYMPQSKTTSYPQTSFPAVHNQRNVSNSLTQRGQATTTTSYSSDSKRSSQSIKTVLTNTGSSGAALKLGGNKSNNSAPSPGSFAAKLASTTSALNDLKKSSVSPKNSSHQHQNSGIVSSSSTNPTLPAPFLNNGQRQQFNQMGAINAAPGSDMTVNSSGPQQQARSITPIGQQISNRNVSPSPLLLSPSLGGLSSDLKMMSLNSGAQTSTGPSINNSTPGLGSIGSQLQIQANPQAHEYSLFNEPTYSSQWEAKGKSMDSVVPPQVDASKAPGYRGNTMSSPVSSKTSSQSITPPSSSVAIPPSGSHQSHINVQQQQSSGNQPNSQLAVQRPVMRSPRYNSSVEPIGSSGNASRSNYFDGTVGGHMLNYGQQDGGPPQSVQQSYSHHMSQISRLNPRATSFNSVQSPNQSGQQSAGGGVKSSSGYQGAPVPPPQPPPQSYMNQYSKMGGGHYNRNNNQQNMCGPQNHQMNSVNMRWYDPLSSTREMMNMDNGLGLGLGSPSAMSPNTPQHVNGGGGGATAGPVGPQDDSRKMPRPIGTERASWKYNYNSQPPPIGSSSVPQQQGILDGDPNAIPPWLQMDKPSQGPPPMPVAGGPSAAVSGGWINHNRPQFDDMHLHDQYNIEYMAMQPPPNMNLMQQLQYQSFLPHMDLQHPPPQQLTDKMAEQWEQHDKTSWSHKWTN